MVSITACFWRYAFVSALAVFSTAVDALTPSQVFDTVKDSVVVVKTQDAQGEETAFGSGVLLPSGKVATNCHVIKDGASFQVGRGKHFVPVTLYASDEDKDLCLLDAKGLGGKPATLGKAASLKVGEAVYAVGAPQGLELSLSDGIVSQLRGNSPPIIQTTAAISPGSSGGGLFDSNGRLVGLTTLYVDGGQSLNFAMPIEWLDDLKPGNKIASKQRNQINWIARAVVLENKRDWSNLFDWGKQWAKTDPDNADAWFFIGEAHQELRQYDKAVAAYHQALRINPEYFNVWNNLGGTFFTTKRYDDAITAYLQAQNIKPDNAGVQYNLGLVYQNLERHDDVIKASRQALLINPEHAGAWRILGLAYLQLKRYEDAIVAFHQALRINPDDVGVWNILGTAHLKRQRYDDAITAFRQSLRINPEGVKAWGGLFFGYYGSGNTAAALQAVKSLQALDPAMAEKLLNSIVPH